MKKGILLYFVLINAFVASAQKDSVKVNLSIATTRLEKDSDFNIWINFISISKVDLHISIDPIFSVFEAGFGDINLRLDRLVDSCFQSEDIIHDPFGIEFKKEYKKIKYKDTVSYSFDFRHLSRPVKGFYRLKVSVGYLREDKAYSAESNWIYFEVITSQFIPKRRSGN